MESISSYNASTDFQTVQEEGRLKKAAKLIGSLPMGRMLDVGCTDGRWGRRWKDKGWDVCGVDVNAANVEQSLANGIDARLADLNAGGLPFTSEEFDLVFAGEVIEHLIDTDGFLQECHRCLKPRGHLIITTPNLCSFENRLRILLGIYPVWVDYRLAGCGHVRAYTPRVLSLQLSERGFSVVKRTGNWVPFVPQRFMDDLRFPWISFTGTIFPSLAMDIIVLARRKT